MSKHNIIPIFIPHVGCPNDCVFCNQRRISGTSEFSIENVEESINEYLGYFKNSNNPIELAFYGGSFTAIDSILMEKLLRIGYNYILKGEIESIRISTRPDAITPEILNILKFYGVKTIELGVQSLNDDVLKLSKRGHDSNSVIISSKLIKESNFKLGLQQMVGLPGDNKDISIETTKRIIEIKPDFVRIYPTLVIKGTELEEMHYDNSFSPLTVAEATDTVSELILMYSLAEIPIIRIGLQSSTNLQFGRDVIAGPLHDAFRELAESELLYKLLANANLKLGGTAVARANGKIISIMAGQKSSNKIRIIEKFGLDNLNFLYDSELKNEIIIQNEGREYYLDLNLLAKNYAKMEHRCI